jgi:hypothetical protein
MTRPSIAKMDAAMSQMASDVFAAMTGDAAAGKSQSRSEGDASDPQAQDEDEGDADPDHP